MACLPVNWKEFHLFLETFLSALENVQRSSKVSENCCTVLAYAHEHNF